MSYNETCSVGNRYHTPMSFSPRAVAKPSPSREEIWKQELGFEGSDTEEFQSETSNTDDEPEVDQITCGTVTAIEMQALQVELKQKDRQREELLMKLKTLTDKTAGYKSRLQKAENTRKSQLKIMKKTHETQLQLKNNVLQTLEDVVEELEQKLSEFESSKENNELGLQAVIFKPSGVRKLVKTVNDLQDEKNAVYESLLSTTSELELAKQEHKNAIHRLTKELSELQENYETLQTEYKNVQNGELSTTRRQDQDKIQHQDEEISKLKKKIQTLEYELESKEASMREMIRKAEDDMMHVRRSLREAEVKYSNLAATPPKVKKVTVVSEETKRELEKMIAQNQELSSLLSKTRNDSSTKISALEAEVKSMMATVKDAKSGEEKAKADCQTLKNSLKEKERDLADTAREQEEKIYSLRNEVIHYKGEVDHFRGKLAEEMKRHMNEKENMEKELREQVKKETQASRRKIEHIKRQMHKLGKVVEEIRRQYKELKIDTLKMCTSIKPLVRETQKQIMAKIDGIDDRTNELLAKYKKEMALRKRYHNELVELKGNIRVYCRVRPVIKEDGGGKMAENVVSFDEDDDTVLSVYSKGSTKQFEMERVFCPESTQEQVFAEVRNLIISCIDGYNVCIFAYGQTGSGKTFTMEGSSEDPGINQRALQLLFEETGDRASDWEYSISVSVMEIYNEMLRDLLGHDPTSKLDIKQGREGLFVPGLVEIDVSNVDEVNEVFALGKRNRATATTDMNEHSSRSHALLCVKAVGVNRTTGARTIGKLNLVDLAGSERVSKSGSEGARMKEAQSINKSLSSLGDVIHSLKNKSSHIPYRNSKLTYLLQESLGGDSKTLMVVQVSPVEKNVGETMCSLNFAQRVRTVELGQATRKAETAEMVQLKDRFRDYKGRSPARPRTPQTPNGKYQR